jgi:hypothetical protein
MGLMFGRAVFSGALAVAVLGLTSGRELAEVMPDMVRDRRQAA